MSNKRPSIKLVETAVLAPVYRDVKHSIAQVEADGLSVLYPEIRAITANKVTKNKTYYSTSALLGNPSEGTGLSSWLKPYPKPVLRDHNTGGGPFGGSPADVLGRVEAASMVKSSGTEYVSVIAKITDPEAVRMILGDLLLTVSIGAECYDVACSICNTNLVKEEPCEHIRGRVYDVDGESRECYWIINSMSFEELSFVVIPSDDEAMIINKNVGSKSDTSKEEYDKGFYIINSKAFAGVRMTESANKDDDDECTIGDLYGAPEDDPDHDKPYSTLLDGIEADDEISMEKKLTKKDRDKLPDSAFCGPNRSFPAHDKTHCIVGLAYLKRYKGPGNKAKIRACLLRKLAQYTKKSKNAVAAGYLIDNKYKIKYPIFPATETTVEYVAEEIKHSTFLPEDKNRLLAGLVYVCNKQGWEVPVELRGVEAVEPPYFELNEQTYPVLYHVMDAQETLILEMLEIIMNNELETNLEQEVKDNAEPEGSGVVDTTTEQASVASSWTCSSSLAQRTHPQQTGENATTATDSNEEEPTETENEEEPAETEKVDENTEEVEDIETLREDLSTLKMAYDTVSGEYNKLLPTFVAVLYKISSLKIANGKSVQELADELRQQPQSSLKFAIDTLLPEIDHIKSPVNNAQTEQASAAAEALRQVAVERLRGAVSAVEDASKKESPIKMGPITEEDTGERVLLLFGGEDIQKEYKESVAKQRSLLTQQGE